MKHSVQKTFQISIALLFIVTSLSVKNVAQAQAKLILSSTEFTVKGGQEKQFEEGIKAWKACYLENKGEWTWTIWKRYNGKGSVYVLTSMSPNWAKMDDENDVAGKKCTQIAMDKIVPHVESTEDNFATTIPELSKVGASEWGVIWVTFFQVSNNPLFTETVKEVTTIMQNVEGDKRGYWYSANGGGPESADYFVTTPYKNFAALDVKRDGVWDLVEKAKGKEYSDKLRNDIRSSIKQSWMYIYKRMDDLSNDTVK